MALPYKPIDWNNFPKDAKIRMLDVPKADDGIFWVKKRDEWKLELPLSSDLLAGFLMTETPEVKEWMEENLLGAPDAAHLKADIRWRYEDRVAVGYMVTLYCEHDWLLFKMRWS